MFNFQNLTEAALIKKTIKKKINYFLEWTFLGTFHEHENNNKTS